MSAEPGFEDLVEFLRAQRGFDFSDYKRPTLERRIAKRIAAVGAESYAQYIDRLQVDSDEFPQLFDTILINVTSFFRDPESWAALTTEALPSIVEADGPSSIRVWSAGCASGEEAFTAAIVLAEALGDEAFRRRVKVYGTDADEDALTHARHGLYSAQALEPLDQVLRDRYFEPSGDQFVFREDLRRNVIFGRHDLVTDAPISRLDLLICRNTLMYFNSELQRRILDRFHFALGDDGYLFLGRAESLGRSELFAPLDQRNRLFTKVPTDSLRDRTRAPGLGIEADIERHIDLRDAAFDAIPVAQVLVDVDGYLTVANQQARALFDIKPSEIGRPLQDLPLSYKPVELRSMIETAFAERNPVSVAGVQRTYGSEGEAQDLDVTVAPILSPAGVPLGVTISFNDVTQYRRLRQQLERSNADLETAYEELQSSNEELETTNEELQSTVEELETTNEELQSANEELETTNEELHSTNTEIQVMNDDVQKRAARLDHAMTVASAVVDSFDVAVIAIDMARHIYSWNQQAEDMWGLRRDEVVGRRIDEIDSGLPVAEFREHLNRCLEGESTSIVLTATDRRGRTIDCHITCEPLLTSVGTAMGGIVIVRRSDSGQVEPSSKTS